MISGRCSRQQRTEKDGVVMVAVETVMLGALCSCLVLSAIGSQAGAVKPPTPHPLPLAQARGANSMPPGSPPLAAVCRGVGPPLYAGVPACGLIATPTNRDRRRRREPKAGGIATGATPIGAGPFRRDPIRARQEAQCEACQRGFQTEMVHERTHGGFLSGCVNEDGGTIASAWS